ncbi:dynein regulatory complex subunit 4-like [Micropterus dolomieu]|uniref:dynein regulatory complex subunit 4-like n=1 Tax=Micropterus dolomieu TaxID=147949 RepID=UPI001E8EA3AC|nr:dynein regulatory complex subunit 4-like [Micropterus dolomieu]
MNMDELWEECVSLQEELKRMRRENKHFQIERVKAQRFWDNSKRNLEETKASMRKKLRLKQEAERCRRTEIEEQKLKLKQLETAHHSEICGLKVAAIAITSKSQNEHVVTEVELQKKMLSLHVDKGEKESHTKIYIGKLKQKQKDELRELNESHERQVREMEAKYENKMKIMAEESNQKIQTELEEIDKRMKECTARLVVEHDEAWEEINWFTVKNHSLYLEMETLKRQLEVEKNKDKRLHVKMAATVQKNKCLTECLRDMEQKLRESSQKMAIERKAMVKRLKRGEKMTARILEERRDLYLKHQQLEMKHIQVEQEDDELQKRQTEAILDVQQKSGLKEMVLERKIKAVTENQEKEQLTLWVVLAFGQGDQTAAKNIKELFESKEATISALKDDLSRDLVEYDSMVKKATALGVSVDKWLPKGDIRKCIRNTSEGNFPPDRKNFDGLMQELMALCISEDYSVQKDTLGLNTAGCPDHEFLQLSV